MYYRVEGLKFRGTGSNINLLSSWRKEGGGIEESVRTTKQPFHIADLVEGASTKLKFEAAEGIKPRVYESKRGNYVASMPRRTFVARRVASRIYYTVNNNIQINEEEIANYSKIIVDHRNDGINLNSNVYFVYLT